MLRINNLHLENFRGFTDTTIDFGEQVTCIAGINGAGKSSILTAISKTLQSLFTSFDTQFLEPSDINRKYPDKIMKVTLRGMYDNKQLERTLDGDTILCFDDEDFTKYRKENNPVIVNYTVNRSDLNIDVSVESERDLSSPEYLYETAFNASTHYKEFFRWFRDREDRENAEMVARYKKQQTGLVYKDKELQAVRNAMEVLLPNFTDMTVDRKGLTVVINKDNETLNFSNLSDGEKNIITLFGDIARRLAIANENLDNPLKGNGIILIDEIELHLHPSWQRKVIPALVKTFPDCQFIITTHSPQVLGEIQAKDIWLLNDFTAYHPDASFGLTSDDILDELMDVNDEDTSLIRNAKISEMLNKLSRLIDQENFNDAKKLIVQIEKRTGGEIHETRKYKAVIDTLGEN